MKRNRVMEWFYSKARSKENDKTHTQIHVFFQGEIFGECIGIRKFGRQSYVVANVWLTKEECNGHVTNTSQPKKYRVFLQQDSKKNKIPNYYYFSEGIFVISSKNHPKIVISDDAALQPIHIRFDHNLETWDHFSQEKISEEQSNHDENLLAICAIWGDYLS